MGVSLFLMVSHLRHALIRLRWREILGRWILLLRQRLTRQHLATLVAHHHVATLGAEEGCERDIELRPARLIPRDPEAVGIADLGDAVVRIEILRLEHIFPFRLVPIDLEFRGVDKTVHHELSFDAARLVVLIVKVHPAAKATSRRIGGMRTDRIFPGDHHFLGHFVLDFVTLLPRKLRGFER